MEHLPSDDTQTPSLKIKCSEIISNLSNSQYIYFLFKDNIYEFRFRNKKLSYPQETQHLPFNQNERDISIRDNLETLNTLEQNSSSGIIFDDLNSSISSLRKSTFPTQVLRSFVNSNVELKNEEIQQQRKPKVAYFDISKLKTSPKEEWVQLKSENIKLRNQLEEFQKKYEQLCKKVKEDPGNTITEAYNDQFGNKNFEGQIEKVIRSMKSDYHNSLYYELKSIGEEKVEGNEVPKSELQLCQEKLLKYKKMYQEKSKLAQFLQDKYEANVQEKDFLLIRNQELTNRLEKLQNEYPSRSLEKTINDEYLIRGNINSATFPEKRQGEQEDGNKEKGNQINTTIHRNDQELIMTFGKGSEKPNQLLFEIKRENENLSSSTSITREEADCPAFYSSFDLTIDENLHSFLQEYEHKLSCHEMVSLENSIKKYVENMNVFIKCNEVIDKYNKLLLQHFKVLEKMKSLERTNLLKLPKTDKTETFDTLDLYSFRDLDKSSEMNKPDSPENQPNIPNAIDIKNLHKNSEQQELNSREFLVDINQKCSTNSIGGIKTLAKENKIWLIKNQMAAQKVVLRDINLKDLKVLPTKANSSGRAKSTPKEKSGYREFYVELRKNYIKEIHEVEKPIG